MKQVETDDSLVNSEIERIRREFDAAKQSFLKIPDALKGMPKMNPEGLAMLQLIFPPCQCIFVSFQQLKWTCHVYDDTGTCLSFLLNNTQAYM